MSKAGIGELGDDTAPDESETFVYQPEVNIVSRPQFLEGHRAFLEAQRQKWKQDASGPATDAELLIEFAGRICYMSFEKPAPLTTREYIQKLIRKGHESVLEHASWTFVIAGVSRAFTHQLVRHRVGFAYSQLSQQYHDERGARLIVPTELQSSPELLLLWKQSLLDSKKHYDFLASSLGLDEDQLASGPGSAETRRALRSAARSVLPNATESIVAVTVNARALRHFLRSRGGIVGDLEMRRVSAALMATVQPEAPSIVYDFKVEKAEDGFPIVQQTPLGKPSNAD